MQSLAENTSLVKLTVKIDNAELNDASENNVFTDGSVELCDALERGIGSNTSIVDLDIANLRFSGRLFDAIGRGLHLNQKIKNLSMTGSLMVILL